LARQPVKKSSTVIKALNILEAVSSSKRAVTLADITDIVGIDRTTAYRLLSTLEAAGYIHRSDDTKRYQLSYKIITLGRNLVDADKRSELIHKTLCQLTEFTNETATYAVLDGTEMVFLMQAKANQILSVDFKVGDRAGLHCSAIGKSVLAFQN